MSKNQSNLATDIKNLINQGVTKPNDESNKQLVKTYWQIGQRISQELEQNNPSYHNSVIKDLSQEINFDRSKLSRCLNFFKIYPKIPNNNNNNKLSWSHYSILITIKDNDLRDKFQNQAIKENWSKQKLIFALKQYYKNLNQPNNNQILTRPTSSLYLYKAHIIEIIDGDTILINLDLGFEVFKQQRIRLANIDAQELKTKKGQKAYRFLTQKLQNIDYIIIKTNKIDIYGRYIAHIFIDPLGSLESHEIFNQGIYLNEEILQEGVADGW